MSTLDPDLDWLMFVSDSAIHHPVRCDSRNLGMRGPLLALAAALPPLPFVVLGALSCPPRLIVPDARLCGWNA